MNTPQINTSTQYRYTPPLQYYPKKRMIVIEAPNVRSRSMLVTNFDFSQIYKHLDGNIDTPQFAGDALRSFLDPNTLWDLETYPDGLTELFTCTDDLEISIETRRRSNRPHIDVCVWYKQKLICSKALRIDRRGCIIKHRVRR